MRKLAGRLMAAAAYPRSDTTANLNIAPKTDFTRRASENL
jgi:hypothetical protein